MIHIKIKIMSDLSPYKFPDTFVGRLTLFNSFLNTILFDVVNTDNMDIGEKIVNHPYKTVWGWTSYGYMWSIPATYLSESSEPKWISRFIINGGLGMANVLMLYKIIKRFR